MSIGVDFDRKIKNLNIEFENRFWSGEDLNILFEEVNNDQLILTGSSSVFRNAFKEFNRLSIWDLKKEFLVAYYKATLL